MSVDMDGAVFVLQRTPADPSSVREALAELGPFRKGPFRLDGVDVPAHWDGDAKWRVLEPILNRNEFRDLLLRSHLRVADVGSNNGYYLFRLLHWINRMGSTPGPSSRFIAFDPVEEFERQFVFLRGFVPDWPVAFTRAGWEDLPKHEPFDCLMCMGVLYHHTDPVEMLRALREALVPGGRLILETMIIPASEPGVPMALVPQGRYAGMRGVWFVPDQEALLALFRRTGWRNIRLENIRDARDEQQRFGDFPSFREMLDPLDDSKTVEGLPSPLRAFVTAQK